MAPLREKAEASELHCAGLGKNILEVFIVTLSELMKKPTKTHATLLRFAPDVPVIFYHSFSLKKK